MPVTVSEHYELLCKAYELSKNSEDPSTKCGAIITSARGLVDGWGWNRFPAEVPDQQAKWIDREQKLKFVVHAEMMALLTCRQSLVFSTLYFVAHDAEGIWGGCPCVRCMVHLLCRGVKSIVTVKPRPGSKWYAEQAEAEAIITRSGGNVIHYDVASVGFE